MRLLYTSRRRSRTRAFSMFAALLGVLLMSSGAALVATAGAASATQPAQDGTHKWFVCKWVGQPGAGDSAHHVISVDDSAISGAGFFSDGQNESYAVVKDTGQAEPGLSQCPKYPGTPDPDAKDATGDIAVTAPGCTGLGSWQVTGVSHASYPGASSGDLAAGQEVSKVFTADDKHLFADGAKTRTVTRTIPQHEGTCETETPQDATATAVPSAPQGCDLPGSFTLSGEHIAGSAPAAGPHAPGTFDVVVTAADNHLFGNGQSTKTISVTVPAYSGTCSDETETPQDATGTITPTAPGCDSSTGTWTVTGLAFATAEPASGTGAVGSTVTSTLHAAADHLFSNGQSTMEVSAVIPAHEGTCSVIETPTTPTTPTEATPVTPAKTTTTKPRTSKPATTGTTTIPSVVHAGLASDLADSAALRTQQGLALLVAGALVLLAGGLGMTRRAHVRS